MNDQAPVRVPERPVDVVGNDHVARVGVLAAEHLQAAGVEVVGGPLTLDRRGMLAPRGAHTRCRARPGVRLSAPKQPWGILGETVALRPVAVRG